MSREYGLLLEMTPDENVPTCTESPLIRPLVVGLFVKSVAVKSLIWLSMIPNKTHGLGLLSSEATVQTGIPSIVPVASRHGVPYS
jgi:hypothetical protein